MYFLLLYSWFRIQYLSLCGLSSLFNETLSHNVSQIRIYLSVISAADHSQPRKCLSCIEDHTKQKTILYVIHVNIKVAHNVI